MICFLARNKIYCQILNMISQNLVSFKSWNIRKSFSFGEEHHPTSGSRDINFTLLQNFLMLVSDGIVLLQITTTWWIKLPRKPCFHGIETNWRTRMMKLFLLEQRHWTWMRFLPCRWYVKDITNIKAYMRNFILKIWWRRYP